MIGQIIFTAFAMIGIITTGHALGIGLVLLITNIQKKIKAKKLAKEAK